MPARKLPKFVDVRAFVMCENVVRASESTDGLTVRLSRLIREVTAEPEAADFEAKFLLWILLDANDAGGKRTLRLLIRDPRDETPFHLLTETVVLTAQELSEVKIALPLRILKWEPGTYELLLFIDEHLLSRLHFRLAPAKRKNATHSRLN